VTERMRNHIVLCSLLGLTTSIAALVQPAPTKIMAADLAVAYYPYHRKLRVRADLSRLPGARNVRQAHFIVTQQGNSTPLAAATLTTFAGLPTRRRGAPSATNAPVGETVIDMPDLASGTYLVTMTLDGGPGVPSQPVVRTFERKVWPWEHNGIGLSRRIISPFTPLQVTKDAGRETRVDAVLRSHRMNGFGLWDQVESKGQEILAAPIRFAATVDRRQVVWKTGRLRFTEKGPDRVVGNVVFLGGTISAQVASDFDYDGMMKVTLTLAPRRSGSLEALDLLIPLKDTVGTLMHVCGDSIRENYAGTVPAGSGVVWTSKGANGHRPGYGGIYGTFMPYVWIGGTERGICWFADTDRDWSLDDSRPALDIVRMPGAVELRVHLINKPTVLDHPRRVVFGLQATPVKPLPAATDGKTWRSWSFLGRYRNSSYIGILGQGLMWGAADPYTEVYPRKRDFAIFDEFAQARKRRNADMGWVDRSGWLDGYNDQRRRQEYRRDVIGGLAAQAADKVLVYTNARGGEDSDCEESRNFNPHPLATDEWNEPVPSYQDFALFYFHEMMTRGDIDGIYVDNTYAKSNWDTVSADAYVRADGTLQPSMGIFNMRSLIRRIATMYDEVGKTPLVMAHMTNACIIPILSFATIGLDWEDKYGTGDFQDKFREGFIRAESIGLQAGLVPVALGGVTGVKRSDPAFARLSRTEFGVASVHEIKIWNNGNIDADRISAAYKPLYEFGYGLSDCRVYRYWDAGQPVAVRGADARSLVLARGGRAMVIVTDFGNGGNIAMSVNPRALGVRSAFTARDAETGEVLNVTSGKLLFPLERHDFREVVLE
jgi:hypothetical protein